MKAAGELPEKCIGKAVTGYFVETRSRHVKATCVRRDEQRLQQTRSMYSRLWRQDIVRGSKRQVLTRVQGYPDKLGPYIVRSSYVFMSIRDEGRELSGRHFTPRSTLTGPC